jgi:hypothetical protein
MFHQKFPSFPVENHLFFERKHAAMCLIPMIVSNCGPPLVVPAGKQAVFHKMAAKFETRIRITWIEGDNLPFSEPLRVVRIGVDFRSGLGDTAQMGSW